MQFPRFRTHFPPALILIAGLMAGCGGGSASNWGNPAVRSSGPASLRAVDQANVLTLDGRDSVALSAAKNETVSFAVEIRALELQARGKSAFLKVSDPTGRITAGGISAFQLLPMPVDLNRAGFVRHTGLPVTDRLMLPRALLPLKIESNGIDLADLRDPAQPANPAVHASGAQPVVVWFDVHVAQNAPAGELTAAIELRPSEGAKPVATLPISLSVYDFMLPDERHLSMVGRVDWDALRRLYPHLETVEPRLISRSDEQCEQAIRTLDQIASLAQANRAQVIFPRLQPTVKWPAGAPVQVDWREFDSVIAPWLRGDAFADKTPINYWPLPAIDFLPNYSVQAQTQYWAEAASHFDQLGWLSRSAVTIERPGGDSGGRTKIADQLAISADAARVLAVHPMLRAMLPLEATQLQIASSQEPGLINPETTGRLIVAAPGLVSNSPMRLWPSDVPQPANWLRTDQPGLAHYTGGGANQSDVRLWGWLAFLRDARMIQWNSPLPESDNPLQPADPADLVWFYPGSWFGIDRPVPTVQLKWLRRAQQDYEYLWLARQRGQNMSAVAMARLLTRPVEIQPNQPQDPTYALMCGTTDPAAWDDARDLLAKYILLHDPNEPASDRAGDLALNIDMLHWATPLERPILMGRSTQWLSDGGAGMLGVFGLRLGIDIYNASDASHPVDNLLQWTPAPPWQVRPQPYTIPSLSTYRVQRFVLDAQIDPAQVRNTDHRPVEISFTNGYSQRQTAARMMIPMAVSDRRPPGQVLNGSLEDWSADDAIQNGPLVQYLNRPAAQKGELQFATTTSSIYSGWSDDNFYVAFKLDGLSQQDLRAAQNFVSYEFRRAWGEDLCELMIQPVYRNSLAGPVLHVVVKPNGSVWVERKGDPRTSADPWPAFEGAGVRFRGTLDGPTWRGEIAIPWKAIDENFNDPKRGGRPVMLRFNFTQHKTDTGESASWAGPIDTGRDDAFTGLLYIRDASVPGMAQQAK